MAQRDWQQAERPIPLIDPKRCDGCGLCVKVCPSGALAMSDVVAIVARPEACDYAGLCETICPMKAIQRPFEILTINKAKGGKENELVHQTVSSEGH